MKTPHFFSFILIVLASLTSCQPSRPCDDVVCETYVHRYGVALEPEDWSERGQHGQIVSTRKDGVVMTRNFEGGVLHGECTYSFPHRENIERKEIYDHGTLVQKFFYYPFGFPQKQVTYDSPDQRTVVMWYEIGVPQCREVYENDLITEGEYYDLSNVVESRVVQASGQRTCRDNHGQLESVDTIQDGLLVSRTTYHPNGAPAAISPYVNGAVEGQRRTFLPGGEPATIETWSNNIQHGKTTVFEHGEKVADVPYVQGRKHGIERRYRYDQTIVQEMPWVQDQKHGPCYSYVGNTKRTDWYFRNQQVPNKAAYDMMCNQ